MANGSPTNMLAAILRRKAIENTRRLSHQLSASGARPFDVGRRETAIAALRRAPGSNLNVIAEFKRRSPSAGVIRPWAKGDVPAIVKMYQENGAAAVSVLCDGPGFGGSALDIRRAAAVATVPLLFKEFILDPVQVQLAAKTGASMVLLLVRALTQSKLNELVEVCHKWGVAPVVEAADAAELTRALRTNAQIVGVNARDLRTFRVDPAAAAELVEIIPTDRVAVSMSAVSTDGHFRAIAGGRADAVLIGEGLMGKPDPGRRLSELLALQPA